MSKCKRCEKECKKYFCSSSCGIKYRSEQNSSKICFNCGGKTRRQRNKFCSKECYTANQQRAKNNCEQCKKECKKRFCDYSCSMKYRHAHKDEYASYFEKLAKGKSSRRKVSEPCLECGGKTPRYYNKFCSQECHAKYRVNHREEYEDAYQRMRKSLTKLPDYICPQCNEKYHPDSKDKKFCSNECFHNYRRAHPEEYVIDVEIRRAGYEKFRKNKKSYEKWRKIVSLRMKSNNPMYDPVVKARAMESCKKYWDTHPKEKAARLKRFMQAPLRGRGKEWNPTVLERKIMDLNIPGLSYVGDGSVFVTIGCNRKRKKNPDFLLRGRKKVVEVGDIEYWHTLDEIKETIAEYNCIGYECLYLTNRDMVNVSQYETRVREFCV